MNKSTPKVAIQYIKEIKAKKKKNWPDKQNTLMSQKSQIIDVTITFEKDKFEKYRIKLF